MDYHVYRTRVRRRRDGRWRVTVPELPGAPGVTVRKLDNAPAELIEQLSGYLGVHESVIGIAPVRPAPRRRPRISATLVQAFGGATCLSGVFLAAGPPATLIAAGAALATLGVLRESGRI
jgi:hypothetical protein